MMRIRNVSPLVYCGEETSLITADTFKGGVSGDVHFTASMAASPEVVKKIEEGYEKLQAAQDCKSLLKKYLTKAVVDKLKVR